MIAHSAVRDQSCPRWQPEAEILADTEEYWSSEPAPNSKLPPYYNVRMHAQALRQGGFQEVVPIVWANTPIGELVGRCLISCVAKLVPSQIQRRPDWLLNGPQPERPWRILQQSIDPGILQALTLHPSPVHSLREELVKGKKAQRSLWTTRPAVALVLLLGFDLHLLLPSSVALAKLATFGTCDQGRS